MKYEHVKSPVSAIAIVTIVCVAGVAALIADDSSAETVSCNFYAADPSASDLTDGSSAYSWVSGTSTDASGNLILPDFAGQVPDGFVFYAWTGYYWSSGMFFPGESVSVDSADHSNFKAIFISADLPIRSTVTVSPIGLADGCAEVNNGADFGPDTPGTTTCGIQEAVDAVAFLNHGVLNGNLSISDEKASGTVILSPGTFGISSEIVLSQGTILAGAGRTSTCISLSDVPGDWLADMRAAIVIPADANNCKIRDLSVSGYRTEGYQAYSVSGISIIGYNWRPVIEDVEIVNFQGSGIETRGSSSDANAVVYEPIFDKVSVISCYVGMTLVACADDALYSVNVEHCSDDGIRYYGGNGKWVDVHVYNNAVGMRIAGQPLRIVACSLDTNKLQGAVVEQIDSSISPGGVVFTAPMAQGNGRDADPDMACAILIEGRNVTVSDLISLNKASDPYQMWGVVEAPGADYNTVRGLISSDVAGGANLLGAHSVCDTSFVSEDEPSSFGGMALLWVAIVGAIVAACAFVTGKHVIVLFGILMVALSALLYFGVIQ